MNAVFDRLLIVLPYCLPGVLISYPIPLLIMKFGFKLRFNGWWAFLITWVVSSIPIFVLGESISQKYFGSYLYIPFLTSILVIIMLHIKKKMSSSQGEQSHKNNVSEAEVHINHEVTPVPSTRVLNVESGDTRKDYNLSENKGSSKVAADQQNIKPMFARGEGWKVGLIIAIAVSIVLFQQGVKYLNSKSNNYLYELVDNASLEINKTCPSKIDKYTTLLETIPQGKMLTFVVQIKINTYSEDFKLTRDEIISILTLGAKSAYCRDPAMAQYRDHKISFRYIWEDIHEMRINEIIVDISDCE